MKRTLYLTAGIVALATGIIGAFLPLLPTTPLVILAAFCFARSNPVWEQKLLEDPRFGPMISQWRERGVIPPFAKLLAALLLAISAIGGLIMLDSLWRYLPLTIALPVAVWILSRPSK